MKHVFTDTEDKKRWVKNSTPMQMLAVSIIHQALKEMGSVSSAIRAEAFIFFESDDFEYWCEQINLRPETVRKVIEDPRKRRAIIRRIDSMQIRKGW